MELPVLALKDQVIFPKMRMPIFVGRRKSLASINAVKKSKILACFTQKKPDIEDPSINDLHHIGATFKILTQINLPDGRLKITVEGINRIVLEKSVARENFLRAKIQEVSIDYEITEELLAKVEVIYRHYLSYIENTFLQQGSTLSEIVARATVKSPTSIWPTAFASPTLFPLESYSMLESNSSPEVDFVKSYIKSPDVFADSIANSSDFTLEERIKCLNEFDVNERLNIVHQILFKKGKKKELIAKAEIEARNKFNTEYNELLLQEQLRIILNELGSSTPLSLYNPVFKGRGFKQNNKLVFALMPFSEKFRPIYTEIIKPTVEILDLKSVRADDLYGPRPIIEDIWRLVNESHIIIADVTSRNPNVFYEIGLAHSIGKDVIIISQSLDDVPFDLRHYRRIIYEDSVKGTKKLEKDLFNSLKESLSLLPSLDES
jgi:Lon protease-like protein